MDAYKLIGFVWRWVFALPGPKLTQEPSENLSNPEESTFLGAKVNSQELKPKSDDGSVPPSELLSHSLASEAVIKCNWYEQTVCRSGRVCGKPRAGGAEWCGEGEEEDE